MTSKNTGRSASQADFLETPGNYSVKPLKPGLSRKTRDEFASSLHKMDETVKERGYIVLIIAYNHCKPNSVDLVWTEVKHITVVIIPFTTVEIGMIKL